MIPPAKESAGAAGWDAGERERSHDGVCRRRASRASDAQTAWGVKAGAVRSRSAQQMRGVQTTAVGTERSAGVGERGARSKYVGAVARWSGLEEVGELRGETA